MTDNLAQGGDISSNVIDTNFGYMNENERSSIMIQPSPKSVKGRNKNTDFLISERQSPDATQSDQINN